MLPSEQRLVQEVIDRLTVMGQAELDSLDRAAMILELEEEFGEEVVRWGIRFFEALEVAEGRRITVAAGTSLWDRDLDGGGEATDLIK